MSDKFTCLRSCQPMGAPFLRVGYYCGQSCWLPLCLQHQVACSCLQLALSFPGVLFGSTSWTPFSVSCNCSFYYLIVFSCLTFPSCMGPFLQGVCTSDERCKVNMETVWRNVNISHTIFSLMDSKISCS